MFHSQRVGNAGDELRRIPPSSSRQGIAFPGLDDPDVSANSAVMAALGGGHPEKHKVFRVMTGWPGQAQVKPGHDSGARIPQCFHGFFCWRKDPVHRVPETPWAGSALLEHPRQLIGNGLEEIAHHRPAFGLQEDFRRHPWRQLQVSETAYLFLLQGDPHIVISA